MKIVYCTPALYMAGGVERVLTMKANHLAEHYGYDITIILTEGKDKGLFYPLSDKIKVVNLDIGFEELWTCSFAKKVRVYLRKQHLYKKLLTAELMRIRPDITISLLRREINFLTSIKDGSKKVGELHVNRANYRNFEKGKGNFLKNLFAQWWMHNLVGKLRGLDRFIVLTDEDRKAWGELSNVTHIPNPLTLTPIVKSPLTQKRLLSVGRYAYQKGYDMLLKAWALVEKDHLDWSLAIYGDGNSEPYLRQAMELGIDMERCTLNPPTKTIQNEYANSSLYVMSSRFEGLPLVLIEAMACGLPVVSFDCPCGPKDVVTPQSGVLVKSGDIGALATALSRLMSDADERRRLSQGAIQRSAFYDINHIGEQWNHLFQTVCSNTR